MGYSTNSSKLQGVGDPGLFGFLGKAVGSVAGTLLKGSPIGIAAGGLLGAIRKQPTSTPPFTMPGGGVTSTFIQQQVPKPGVSGAIQRALPGGQTGFVTVRKKRRRMDPLNVKALRRSTRRLSAFQREAKKVEKELRKLAPPARRRSSPSHHHHK